MMAGVLFAIAVSAQQKERRIYLWDTTYSLVSPYGIWDQVKSSLIKAIDNIEINPQNTIVVVPFNKMGAPTTIWEIKATEARKKELISKIKNFASPSKHTKTDICSAISKFHSLTKKGCVNYMFLFTDGEDENDKNQQALEHTLKSWNKNSEGEQVYGFYIVYDKIKVRPKIESIIKEQNNLWLVHSADINVNLFEIPAKLVYNIRNDKEKEITVTGNLNHAENSEIHLSLEDNSYYSLRQTSFSIKGGKISFQLIKKQSVVPDEVTLNLSANLKTSIQYSYLMPENIKLIVVDKKEKTLTIRIRKK